MNRRQFVVSVAAILLLLSSVPAARQPSARDTVLLDALVSNLTHLAPGTRERALGALDDLGDPRAIPALIELLRFDAGEAPLITGILERLAKEHLAGERLGLEWADWVEWLQKHDEIHPNPGFRAWKAHLFSRIDPNFDSFLAADLPHRVRIEEIVWGGVRKGHIPALTNPAHIKPEEAVYLTPQELVFGISINGDHRAYPLRILDWHEMFNDVVGGKPVSLSY